MTTPGVLTHPAIPEEVRASTGTHRRGPRRVRWAVALGALVLFTACSASTGGGTTSEGPLGSKASTSRTANGETSGVGGLSEADRAHLLDDVSTTWDVTLSDDTTLVDGDALDALTADDGAGTYTFDAERAKGLDLGEGRVLLIAGRALRRITASTTTGSSIEVRTEPASLADAIESGTVGWDVPLEYSFDQFVTDPEATRLGSEDAAHAVRPHPARWPGARPQIAEIGMRMPDGRTVAVATADGDDDKPSIDVQVKPEEGTVEWTFASAGNKYQFRVRAQGDSAEFLVVVSRGGDEPTMAYRAEGSVGSLRSASESTFGGGEVSGSTVGIDGLSAELRLSASVAGAGASPVELDLPVPFLKFIWMVGPIPVTVELAADIVGNVQASLQASATAEAKFSYRGDVGFRFDGADISASGNTDIGKFDAEPADSAAPMGVNVDAQFGVAFPRVSLSLFGQGLIPSVHYGTFIGSNLSWGEPKAGFAASSICKSAYVRAEVVGKYEFSVLGVTLKEGEHTFWEDRKDAENEGCENYHAAD